MPVLISWATGLLFAMLLMGGCTGTGGGPQITQGGTPNSGEDCDGTLARFQIVEIAKRAILATGGEPESLEREFDVEIYRLDCDYFLSALHRESTLHFKISVSTAGEILSSPWCCVPGFEVDTTDVVDAVPEASEDS